MTALAHVEMLTPVGAVIAYAGDISPGTQAEANINAQGWMLCDGRELPVDQYPELFAVLGYIYGGYSGRFQIPDYRGYFLRGVDAGAMRDPDLGQRRPPGGQGRYDSVGSTQMDALQDHVHTTRNPFEVGLQPGPMTASGPPGGQVAPSGPVDEMTGGGMMKTSRNETRPVNIYVNYLIKFINRR